MVVFASKNALVEAYLRRREREAPIPSEMELDRDDLPAAERLLAIFQPLEAHGGVLRGCPFHNAAVESAGSLSSTDQIVWAHKLEFTRRLVAVAQEAGIDVDGNHLETAVDLRRDLVAPGAAFHLDPPELIGRVVDAGPAALVRAASPPR